MSSLYDRRLLVLLLKNYSHGRRAFTEGCRISKMLLTTRGKCYEESTYTKKYNIQTQTQTNIQEKQLSNTKTTPPYEYV
jgi:hypothetical protein